jgi:surfeit locus 1 family protein
MSFRYISFAVVAFAAAGTFVSLGVWQLDRLSERRAFNSQLQARAHEKPVSLASLPADTSAIRFRRVAIAGSYDFAREVVLTTRSRRGSPGVNIITPVKIGGSDTAILVNRGWVYSPDGMSVDLARWREPATVRGEAYVERFTTRPGSVRSTSVANAYRWMDYAELSQAFPYPIAPYYLVLMGNSENPPANVPPRVPVPPLDEGSHKSYALQWFSFAAISIIGMTIFLRRR